mgnify:CR=1 FL=1
MRRREEEYIRQVLSGKAIITSSKKELLGRPGVHVGCTETIFFQMIAEKMKRSEAQRFLKVGERSERAFLKTSILAMKCAK